MVGGIIDTGGSASKAIGETPRENSEQSLPRIGEDRADAD